MAHGKRKLNILWLWPDILNQHGDRGNVMALMRICGLYGIDTEVTRIGRLTDDFVFDGFDIAILGPGELMVMPAVTGALKKRHTELKAWTDSGGLLFVTGTTGAAMGVHTTRLDGSHIYGLGLLDMECREREIVLGDDLIFRPEFYAQDIKSEPEIYSVQIHMIDITLGAGQMPFGRTTYGYGNNGRGDEGAVKNGIIFSNALGPVLVKNPWLTLELINRALKECKHEPLVFDPNLFAIELESVKVIQKFNNEKEKPKGAHPYLR